MKRKILLSPLLIIILIAVFGVGMAGAAIYFGGSGGGDNSQGINLQKGLVGWWKMDGNAKDSTPNSNHGTVTGATLTTDRKSQANKAFSFNGSSNYISVADSSSLRVGTPSFTFSAWINPGTITGCGADGSGPVCIIFNKESAYEWAIASNGNINWAIANSSPGWAWRSSGLNAPSGTWTHVVVTYNGSKIITYKNGGSPNSQDGSGNITNNSNGLRIGARGAPGAASSFFPGSINDVRIYSRALSAVEVNALYQEYNSTAVQISDLQKGLVGNWKMNGNAKDSSPNSNYGTIFGATLTTDRKGQLNKAYSFDGVNNYIETISPVLASDTTVSVWWKRLGSSGGTGSGAYHTLICGTNGATCYQNRILVETGGTTATIQINGPTSDQKIVTVNSTGWNHIVWTFTDSTKVLQVYVNGVAAAPFTSSISLPTGTNRMRIGALDTGGVYYIANGIIDDARVYNRALSSTEVADLYREYDPGLVVSDLQKGLVGNWKMDGNAKDSTPYSNHGTVNGANLTSDRKGQLNKTYNFSSGNYIDVGNGSSLQIGLSDFTISAWIKTNSAGGGYGRIVDKNFASGYIMAISSTYGNSGNLCMSIGGLYTQGRSGSRDLRDSVWHHVAVVFNRASTAIYYVDGNVDGTTTDISSKSSTNLSNATNFKIGNGTTGDSPFVGLIDDVRIYNRALSPDEITTLYQSY